MQRTTLLAFAAGVAATTACVFLTGFGPDHDHDHDGKGHGGAAHTEMTPEEEMAAWMEAMMPGEHHKAMAKSVGAWSAKTSFTMEPGAPPVEGEGTMTSEWVLGGRYIKSQFHMDDMMGMPFDGLAYNGYDNLRQQYVGTWMDTFGTGIMYSTGKLEGDTMTMHGSVMTPQGESEMKIVSEWQDDDHFTDTFYDKMPDGSWQQSGHIKYTRK